MALVALALLAAACAGTELDTSAIASDLSDQLSAALGRDISVSCPSGIDVEEGGEFTCQATGPDGSFEILVTQSDTDGNVTARRKSIDPAEIEQQISDSIGSLSNLEVEVDCPDEIEVGANNSFECEATTERGSQTIVVTQEDDFGTVSYDAKEKD